LEIKTDTNHILNKKFMQLKVEIKIGNKQLINWKKVLI